ncbi:MAG: T9SS type A sorting domain-containing protein, partial [Candidatus Eisenbacteria bacterium]|nr:T9SS type A sorting domain-containing protein [Candidatus Eisenbacteria bacterium]
VLASPLIVIDNPFLGTASLSFSSSQTGLAGERLTLPLTLERSASVETIEFSIALDPNRWQFPSVVLAGEGAGSTLEQSLENDILDVAILASTPIPSGKGVVAQLQLVPAFGASGQQTLAFSELRILGDDQLPFETTGLPETVSITGRTPVLNLNLVASLTAAAGDTVSLPLQFDSNVEISALQFALAYNRLTLEPIDLEIGSLLTAGPTVTHNNGSGGTWNFSAFYPGGGFLSPGGGPVANLRFVVLEDAPGNGDLQFVMAEAANPEGLTLEVNATTSDVVPVTLLYFLGESVDSGIRLTWAFGQDAPLALELERASPSQASERFSLDPQVEFFFDTSAEPGIVYTYRLFARDRNGKLETFGPVEGRFEPNSRITLLSANPFQHSVGALLVGVEKAVLMDVRGRLVREFQTSGASSRIHWDGRDRNGNRVPAGVYFLRVVGEGTIQTTRLVKLP